MPNTLANKSVRLLLQSMQSA